MYQQPLNNLPVPETGFVGGFEKVTAHIDVNNQAPATRNPIGRYEV
jgi:hypothetical protein